MKKYPLGLAAIGLSVVLAGCGSQADCASNDVHETYLGLIGNFEDQEVAEILTSSVFQSVVTKAIDEDTGYRSCTARIVLKNEAGTRERNISYQIEQVDSADASFKVYADRTELQQVAHQASALAGENRANKKTKELVDAAAANPYILADEQDAREVGFVVARRFFGDRVDTSSVRATPLDIDGDGVTEFLTAMKINYTSGDSKWYAFASHQFPTGPGEKNSVGFAGEGAIEIFGVEPASYEMQGKSLVVTTVDGSKKSLAYHTSFEAYQAYIRANGGNPSVPLTPSAMSRSAAPGAASPPVPASVAESSAGVIDAVIATQAKQDGGTEYVEARKSIEGDINGDGSPDVAVLYVLEGAGGGNGSVSYLVAFERDAGQLKLIDTTTLSGSARGFSVSDGAVHLKLLSLGPDDSACCPSIEEETTYMLKGGKWLQVQAQP